jgi:hypothetical protein
MPKVDVTLLADATHATVTKGISLDADGTATIGRDDLGIVDKRLSRKQIKIRVAPDGILHVTRVGPNASFLQIDKTRQEELEQNVQRQWPPSAIVYLSRDPSTQACTYPIKIATATPPAAHVPVSTTSASPTPVYAAHAAMSAPPDAVPADGVWEVLLGGAFTAYESTDVQRSLEEAFHVGCRPRPVHCPVSQIAE